MQRLTGGLRRFFNRDEPATKALTAGQMSGQDIIQIMQRSDQPAPFGIQTLDPFQIQAMKSISYNRFVTDFINDTGGRANYYDMALIENAYRTSVYLFASLRKVAWLLSTVPIKVEQREGSTWVDAADAGWLPEMLERDMPGVWYRGYMNYALYGNLLIYKRKNYRAVIAAQRGERDPFTIAKNGVSGLHVIPGFKYQPDIDYTAGLIRGFFMSQTEEGVVDKSYLDRNEVIYHHDYDPRDEHQGTSVVQVAINDAFTDASVRQWAGQYFTAGALPLVLVTYDGGASMTETDARKYKYMLEEQWSGVGSAFRSAVLDYPVNVQTVGIEADKVAAPELNRNALNGISSAVGLPADLIVPPEGGSDNARHKYLMKQAFTDTVLPVAKQIVSAMNLDLGMPNGLRLVIDEAEISALDADRGNSADVELRIYQGGLETVGEARAKVGMDESPVDDWWWQNGQAMSWERLQRRDEIDTELLTNLTTAWDSNAITRRQFYELQGLKMPDGYKDGFKFEVVVEGSGGAALGTAIIGGDPGGSPDGSGLSDRGPVTVPDKPLKPGDVQQTEPGESATYQPKDNSQRPIEGLNETVSDTEQAQAISVLRLNGAQITAVTDILEKVTARQTAPEVARQVLLSVGLSPKAADDMINAAIDFKPAAQPGDDTGQKTAKQENQETKEISTLPPAAPFTAEAERLRRIRPGAENPRPGRAAIKPEAALTPEQALAERNEIWLPMAKSIGEQTGIDWQQVSLPHFRRALEAQIQNASVPVTTVDQLLQVVPRALESLQPGEHELVIEVQAITLPEPIKPETRARWVTAVVDAGRIGAVPDKSAIPLRLHQCLTAMAGEIQDSSMREETINAARQAIYDGWFDGPLDIATWYNPLNLYLDGKARQVDVQAEIAAWQKVAEKSVARAVDQFESYHVPDAAAGLLRQRLSETQDGSAVKAVFADVRQRMLDLGPVNEAAKAYAGLIASTTPVWTADERETRVSLLRDTYRTSVLSGLKRWEWTAQSYKANLYELLKTIFDISKETGDPSLTRNQAAERGRRLVSVHLQAAFEDGLDQANGSLDDLSDEQRANMQSMINDERRYMTQFVREIYAKAVPLYREVLANSEDVGFVKDPEKKEQIQQQLLQNLKAFEQLRDSTITRLDAWVNKGAAQMQQLGMLAARSNQRLEWVWNPSKEHCKTCAVANGQIHRARDWDRYGLRPRGDKLICGGFYCGCNFMPTNERARGSLRRIPLRAAGKEHAHDDVTLEEAVSYAKAVHGSDPAMQEFWTAKSIELGLSDTVSLKAVPKKYEGIDFKPTAAMAENAKRALERRAELPESKRGMTDTGIARARDIKNRRELSPETWREMNAWFARHKKTSRNSPNYGDREKAWVAWQGWGGDEGESRAASIVSQMETADEKDSDGS